MHPPVGTEIFKEWFFRIEQSNAEFITDTIIPHCIPGFLSIPVMVIIKIKIIGSVVKRIPSLFPFESMLKSNERPDFFLWDRIGCCGRSICSHTHLPWAQVNTVLDD